jgi:hypothetical protein
MQLPLDVCRKFGQFAYQDEQKGVEAIAAIQDFIEEYQDVSVSGNESQAKVVTIERDKAGVVVVTKAKTQKLPNLIISIKDIVTNSGKLLDKSTDVVTIVGGLSSESRLFNVAAIQRLIRFGIDLATVKLESEQAGVLVALHHLCGGELALEIPLSELQAKMQNNYHFSLSVDELDKILKELRKLRCISRRKNRIYLTEKIILKDD